MKPAPPIDSVVMEDRSTLVTRFQALAVRYVISEVGFWELWYSTKT